VLAETGINHEQIQSATRIQNRLRPATEGHSRPIRGACVAPT
jgi:hypothetical protein